MYEANLDFCDITFIPRGAYQFVTNLNLRYLQEIRHKQFTALIKWHLCLRLLLASGFKSSLVVSSTFSAEACSSAKVSATAHANRVKARIWTKNRMFRNCT